MRSTQQNNTVPHSLLILKRTEKVVEGVKGNWSNTQSTILKFKVGEANINIVIIWKWTENTTQELLGTHHLLGKLRSFNLFCNLAHIFYLWTVLLAVICQSSSFTANDCKTLNGSELKTAVESQEWRAHNRMLHRPVPIMNNPKHTKDTNPKTFFSLWLHNYHSNRDQ